MCKKQSICQVAASVAGTSKSLHQLGACITKGRRILSSGHNHDRTRMMGCYECHAHAEMDAARNFLSQHNIYDVPWAMLKGRCVEGTGPFRPSNRPSHTKALWSRRDVRCENIWSCERQ